MSGADGLWPRIRQRIPLGVRLGLRRVPAVLRWARAERLPRADRADFSHCQATRRSPLRRPGTTYEEALQSAKETNVRRAACLIDGALLAPGATFDWHIEVGPPMGLRGFARGPELHGEALQRGRGGGACQVANLLFWLALHSGLSLLERHRHALDLFPDSARTVPFGCGATVFFPTRNLRVGNPHPWPVLLSTRVIDGWLVGEARMPADPGLRWEVCEREAGFVQEDGDIWRRNSLYRRCYGGEAAPTEELIARNRARVCYPVTEQELSG